MEFPLVKFTSCQSSCFQFIVFTSSFSVSIYKIKSTHSPLRIQRISPCRFAGDIYSPYIKVFFSNQVSDDDEKFRYRNLQTKLPETRDISQFRRKLNAWPCICTTGNLTYGTQLPELRSANYKNPMHGWQLAGRHICPLARLSLGTTAKEVGIEVKAQYK